MATEPLGKSHNPAFSRERAAWISRNTFPCALCLQTHGCRLCAAGGCPACIFVCYIWGAGVRLTFSQRQCSQPPLHHLQFPSQLQSPSLPVFFNHWRRKQKILLLCHAQQLSSLWAPESKLWDLCVSMLEILLAGFPEQKRCVL